MGDAAAAVGERRAAIARAAEDARAIRGTVVLERVGQPRRWCAVCASVEGELEVRLAEPRRGWRVWRASPGERWLADRGFTHRVDAWVRPLGAGASPGECAAILDEGLERALDVRPGDALRRSLVQPGLVDGVARPAPDAGHDEHIAAALTVLVARGRGVLDVECGRPARPAAWAYLDDGGLIVDVQSCGAPGDHVALGRFAASAEGAAEASLQLSARLRRDLRCAEGDPLFVALLRIEE